MHNLLKIYHQEGITVSTELLQVLEMITYPSHAQIKNNKRKIHFMKENCIPFGFGSFQR